MHREEWDEGVEAELFFWSDWFATKGGSWPEDYQFRVSPNSRLQPHLEKFLPTNSTVEILDVGAGPLSCLGKVSGSSALKITACDALADQYREICPYDVNLDDLIQCKTERLSEVFSPNSFDLVHARNTLDHSEYPFLCANQMFAVAKNGGALVLDHFANEATNENGVGFHQWDFFISNGKLMVRRFGTTEARELLAGVEGSYDVLEVSPDSSGHCFLAIRKA